MAAPLALVASGCHQEMDINDPRMKPFTAMYQVDRDQYGMTPLPKHAIVSVERRESDEAVKYGYDVMLHISGNAVHHVAFRFGADGYKWVGEQEECWGPRKYDSVDGRFNEALTISYFHKAQFHLEGLSISYRGHDDDLRDLDISRGFTVAKARQILRDWGCGPDLPIRQGIER